MLCSNRYEIREQKVERSVMETEEFVCLMPDLRAFEAELSSHIR